MRAASLGRGDDGAVLVWAAFLITVLLGVGALVIDVGALYLERRELQNGADAAALAVAKDCAEGDCDGADSAEETAGDLADDNANDGEAAVDLVCGEGEGIPRLGCAEPSGLGPAIGWARVDTSTLTEDGETQFGFLLAPFIGAGSGATVTATATAAWGPARDIEDAVPMAMSTCALTDDGGPPDPGDLPQGGAVVHFHDSDRDQDHASDCSQFGFFPWWPDPPWSWDDRRLGFGWLAGSVNCAIDLQVDQQPDGRPGSADPDVVECDPATWRDKVLTVPVYDRANDRFSGPTRYEISGFVGFRVTAYHLGEGFGSTWGSPDCDWFLFDQLDCIEGEFVPLTTTVTTSGTFSTGPDYGVRTVRMVG